VNLKDSDVSMNDTPRVLDDLVSEMMSFTKRQILSHASTQILAQANQHPQNVLELLT
jgi:flagellin-like hook-associated protein FlgL